jgi:asparagine N-glycosylation enzyme membrane subunit Stt3
VRRKGFERDLEGFVQRNHVIFLSIVFIVGLLLRLGPYIREPNLPYGEGDAAYHFQMSKLIAEGGYPQEFNHILDMPGVRYGSYVYPPVTHTGMALLKLISGANQLTASFIYVAFMDSLLIATTFLLVKELFGYTAGIASSLIISVSKRNIQSLLWGQWPSLAGMVFIPLILLYGIKSLRDSRYAKLCGLFCGLSFLTYPQSTGYSLFVLSLIYVSRRVQIKPKTLKKLLTSFTVVFIVLALPTAPKIVQYFSSENVKAAGFSVSRLAEWYPSVKPGVRFFEGYPPSWFNPLLVYDKVLLALVLLSLTALFFNNNDRRVFASANILVFYLITHSDVFGLSPDRVVRQFNSEVLLFAFIIPMVFTVEKAGLRKYFFVVAVLLVSAYFLSRVNSLMPLLYNTYSPKMRLTPREYEAGVWLKRNTHPDSIILFQGKVYGPVTRWIAAVSDRRIATYSDNKIDFDGIVFNVSLPDYVLLDYTPLVLPPEERTQNTLIMYALEQQLMNYTTLVYENDEIAVRKFD